MGFLEGFICGMIVGIIVGAIFFTLIKGASHNG